MHPRELFFHIAISLFLFCIPTSTALGFPPVDQLDNSIEYFSPKNYHGDLQVWSIVNGKDEKLFVATTEGLSLYDGTRWSSPPFDLYALRALYYDIQEDLLYCGGDNEFGVWRQDNCGQFHYTSLFKNQDPQQHKIIWHINRAKEFIYFQAPKSLFRYHLKHKTVEEVFTTAGEVYNFITSIDETLYAQVGAILYRLEGESMIPLPYLFDDRIMAMFKEPITGEILIFREHKGIFVIEPNATLRPLHSGSNAIIGEKKISIAQVTPNGNYLISTILDGIYLITAQGEIITHIDTQNGLSEIAAHSLTIDHLGNYWLGLDAGIIKINKSPNEEYLTNYNTDIGSVYTLLNVADKLYIGTNKGLYLHQRASQFDLIDGTQGQIWNIQQLHGEVIVSHDFGVVAVDGTQLRSISKGGVWGMIQSHSDPDLYISANYAGFSLYRSQKGQLQWVHDIIGFNSDTRLCAFDKYGYMWVMSTNTGFFRVEFSPDYSTIIESKIFTVPNPRGLMHLFEIDRELIFYANSKTYRYDRLNETLIADEYTQSIVDRCGANLSFMRQYGNLFWYANPEGVGFLARNHNTFTSHPSIFQNMDDLRIPAVFQRISAISGSTFAYGLRNRIGFFEYQPNQPQKKISPPKFAGIEITDNEEIYFVPLNQPRIRLSTHYDNIKITLRDLNDNNLILYRILGVSDDWEQVRADQYLPIPRLTPGRYTLQIRNYGQEEDELLELGIAVTQTPLLSVWAMLIYLTVILTTTWAIDSYHRKRSHLKVERVMHEEQLKQQQEREAMERNALTHDLKERDKKLASYMMSEINKNNLLINLKEDLIQQSQGNSSLTTDQLIRKIDRQLNSIEDWRVFLKYFNNIYDGFFDRLQQQYPTLSIADQKLCAYLKSQLNTKEIAILLNISPSSVDTARHRLRKKLNINTQTSLSTFLANI